MATNELVHTYWQAFMLEKAMLYIFKFCLNCSRTCCYIGAVVVWNQYSTPERQTACKPLYVGDDLGQKVNIVTITIGSGKGAALFTDLFHPLFQISIKVRLLQVRMMACVIFRDLNSFVTDLHLEVPLEIL